MEGLVINSGGLGSNASAVLTGTPSLTNAGWANACGDNFPAYMLDFNCWGQSYADWQTAWANFNTITVPPPASLGVPSIVATNPTQVVPDTTGQASQDISNAQLGASQAAIAAANPSVGTMNAAGLCPWYCSMLDCDANCNLQLDGTTLMWLAGSIAAILLVGKLL